MALPEKWISFSTPTGGSDHLKQRFVHAATLEDALRLCQQRREEIAANAKRERDEELSAMVRLLDL